jgi:hypothetical protein
MRVKINGVTNEVEGIAPFQGAVVRFDLSRPKAESHYPIIKDIKKYDNKGIIIYPSDFNGKYRMMLEFCKKAVAKGLYVAIVLDKTYFKFLEELGLYSIRETKMDESVPEKMFTTAEDMAIPIGATILDYYVKNSYFVVEPEQTILIKEGVIYGSED